MPVPLVFLRAGGRALSRYTKRRLMRGRGSAARAGGRFVLEGGGRLRRFIFRVENELTPEAIAREAAAVLRSRVVPQLRLIAPRRTGVLVDSIEVVRRGATVELRAAFYGRFVKTVDNRDFARVAMQLVEDSKDEIRQAIENRLRALI